jgi:TRAP-type mannitol/chloroaromatic compound transport system permease large subunit
MAEAIIDFREMSTLLHRLMPVLMLLVLGLLGSIRLGVGAPVSGHALVASYFIVHELSEKRLGRTWKLLLGCAVLIQTAVFKIFIWSDAVTLLLGIGFGISAWGLERIVVVVWAVRASKRRAR